MLSGALACSEIAAADPKDAEFVWNLPPGFPKPAVPPSNPMSTVKVELGCQLFFDTRLSVNNTYSCASCHRPELAFSDGRVTALGATGEQLRRNAMSLTNVAYNSAYTWASSRLVTLEEQMETPLFGNHPVEMGLQRDNSALVERLAGTDYARTFQIAFPMEQAPLSLANLIKAIAAYERTLISGRSEFDRYVFDDVRDALTPNAKRGMSLFFSARSGCVECHSGVNFSGTLTTEQSSAQAMFVNTGLYNINGQGAYPDSDTGLLDETGTPRDMGRFRVPTLRNVALTAPYMHDGSIATLAEVVEHYVRGGRHRSTSTSHAGKSLLDRRIKPLSLTIDERADLVAFLFSLTDREFATADHRECSRIAAD